MEDRNTVPLVLCGEERQLTLLTGMLAVWGGFCTFSDTLMSESEELSW